MYKTQGGEADTDSVRFRSRADTAYKQKQTKNSVSAPGVDDDDDDELMLNVLRCQLTY